MKQAFWNKRKGRGRGSGWLNVFGSKNRLLWCEKTGSPLGFLSQDVVTVSESNDLTSVLTGKGKKKRKNPPLQRLGMFFSQCN